ncbi:MAG: Rpn family recombination-promoting nuclease/putative transposase [Treponema sp.]|nr:Rpn family recombination-promoting nuclease/putative transposase [Treponema sp.]
MTRLEYTLKTDTLFKMLFVQHPDLLENLVSTLLSIPPESIGQFVITNPEIPPDSKGEKFCRLDINMVVEGQRVALEVQVENEGDYPDRILYYWARGFSASLGEGGDYKDLPRTVIISILDFIQFAESPDFHSEFRPLEVKRHEPLSDKMSLHFFELKKLPADKLDAGNKLLLWLSLFKANTKEEIAQIKALKEPIMEQAINAFEKIMVTPEFQELERLRSRARHNETSALRYAREKGREEGREKGREEGMGEGMLAVARNALSQGLSIEVIQSITGLDMETIKSMTN